MIDNKQIQESQKRLQEITRLKNLNKNLKTKSQAQDRSNMLEKPTEDNILFGLFSMFKFG